MRYTALAQPMAAEVAHLFEAHFASLVDAVVPVPIHWTRRVHRGFNQSELLCEDLPKEIVNPTLLARVRRTKPQASLTPEERLNSLAKAFWASPDVRGRHILLVDDVVTSGATLNQCALALKQQGAAKVSALAFAGVP
jgi:ComF family protein